MKKRVNLTLDELALEKIDKAAKEMGTNRSNYISFVCLERIKNEEKMEKSILDAISNYVVENDADKK